MQIGSLSSAAALTQITRPSAPTPASSAPAAASTSAALSSPAKSTTAASSSHASTVAALYTTTISGKTYSGDVEFAAGQYVVSVPGLLGATASGSTEQAAENSLGPILSELA